MRRIRNTGTRIANSTAAMPSLAPPASFLSERRNERDLDISIDAIFPGSVNYEGAGSNGALLKHRKLVATCSNPRIIGPGPTHHGSSQFDLHSIDCLMVTGVLTWPARPASAVSLTARVKRVP